MPDAATTAAAAAAAEDVSTFWSAPRVAVLLPIKLPTPPFEPNAKKPPARLVIATGSASKPLQAK